MLYLCDKTLYYCIETNNLPSSSITDGEDGNWFAKENNYDCGLHCLLNFIPYLQSNSVGGVFYAWVKVIIKHWLFSKESASEHFKITEVMPVYAPPTPPPPGISNPFC